MPIGESGKKIPPKIGGKERVWLKKNPKRVNVKKKRSGRPHQLSKE